MSTGPLEPARIRFPDDGGPPEAPEFGDVYHPRAGALAQARHVFLAGNGLPARWAGRERFTMLETGFGLGGNFLATWQAWRADPARPRRLHWVSVERHPPRRDDLARALARMLHPDDGRGAPSRDAGACDESSPGARLAQAGPAADAHGLQGLADALLAAWPPLSRGLHRLDFDGGAVVLTLAFGDAAQVLPTLRLAADAIVLDGFAPDRNPALWSPALMRTLARLAAPGCTAATWSVARPVHEALRGAGFVPRRQPGIGHKREITVSTFEPGHALRGPVALAVHAAARTEGAVVIGAGIAGAAAARALAAEGWPVRVLDAAAEPASGASGNPAGLFHATVNVGDGPYARLFRAAALHAARTYAGAIAAGVPGRVDGLLRLASDGQTLASMQAELARQGLPPEVAEALSPPEASARAGVALNQPAWRYPLGGWVDPAAWVRHVLGAPGIGWRGDAAVATLRRGDDGRWVLGDAHGTELDRAALVVMAHAAGAAALMPRAGWPLAPRRGQVTWWSVDDAGGGPLKGPLAGDGYALPLPDRVLCGATRQPGDTGLDLRDADHAANLARFRRLTGLAPPDDPSRWRGRAGVRVHSDDRLPLAGAVPVVLDDAERATRARRERLTQPRHWPREPGLFVLAALGSRGLTLAPLLGELVAAQASGAPWPLEQPLADAVDPARWLVRRVRREA